MGDKRGYSLIELVMVVGLVAILAITSTQLLLTSLSGSSKASVLATLKQNGDYAIGIMERVLRDAIAVECLTGDQLLVTDANGTTAFMVEDDSSLVPPVSRVASNSAASPNNYLTGEKIQASNFQCLRIPGTVGNPDVVLVSFRLTLGRPGVDRTSEVVQETFETRVSLRTY